MANPNFLPSMSTNDIWRDLDQSRCLTDDLDTIESDIATLETNKANTTHTHDGYALIVHEHSFYADIDHNHNDEYASINHTHSGYAAANHSHTDYALENHTHDGYASEADVTQLQALVGNSSVATQISTAIESKANVVHTHAISDVADLANELDLKYEKPSTGISKSDLAQDVQVSLGKADTAVQSLSGYATEDYVNTKVAGLVDSAPDTLNTLNELATALGDDSNFATTVATQIGGKVDKVDGKELSSNDYTDAEKTKLDGIEAGANKTIVDSSLSDNSTNPVQNKVVNAAISNLNTLVGNTSVANQITTALNERVVQADWFEGDSSSPAYIKNRPFGHGLYYIEKDLTNEYEITGSGYLSRVTDTDSTLYEPYNDENTVKVYFDDAVYSCTVVINNGRFELASDVELPFTATEYVTESTGNVMFTALDGGTHTVKLTHLDMKRSTLPEEYLPESVVVALENMATQEYVNTNIASLSNPNLLINGDFQVWQRGERFSNIANAYSADRWLIKNAKAATSLVEKSTDVPDGQPMCQSLHMTEVTEENSYLRYNFEHMLRGTFTLSFWYKTSAAFNTYIHDNGTLIHLGKSETLNKWTRAFFTFSATALTFLSIVHAMSVGDTYIAGVKLEYGAIATPFTPKLYVEELAMCRRYLDIISGIRVLGVERSLDTNTISFSIPRTVQMRAVPTISIHGSTVENSTEGICVRNLEYGNLLGYTFTYEARNWEILVSAHSDTTLDRQCYEAQLYIHNNFLIYLDAEIY